MADTWREFWVEMDAQERRWHSAHVRAEAALECVVDPDALRFHGVSPGGLWSADVMVPWEAQGEMFVGYRTAQPGRHVVPIRVEARTPAELALAALAVARRGPARG